MTRSSAPIAVIGMALRVPGASSTDDLWRNVSTGECSVRRFTSAELLAQGLPADLVDHPDYVPVHGVLDGVDEFDAGLFGLTPREAELTDPQHRKFLECAHEALDLAGYGTQPEGTRIGVVAGTGSNGYLLNNVLGHTELVADMGEHAIWIASEKDHVATRTAHRLDLHGPAYSVQTSCSTSLVAVHLAVQALRAGDADLMLAGGSTIQVPHHAGHLYVPDGIASPDGACRAFDESATGTVFGSGVGVVVLKPLDAALADGDHVRAVIRGSATNNDGARKVGYNAPSVKGQVAAIRAALADGDVDASSVGYVETHGTGTALGDVIEVEALREAYGTGLGRRSCALGTLKPNIGHVDSAAGVCGLIKAVLVLEQGQVPPNVGFTRSHPDLRLEDSPFFLTQDLEGWPGSRSVRRAAVSSFGLGGTNAHVVLEQAPEQGVTVTPTPAEPVVVQVSAATSAALQAGVCRLRERLPHLPAEVSLHDVAHTLRVGRRPLKHRAAVVTTSLEELSLQLATEPAVTSARRPSVALMFTGFGGQWTGMAAGLHARHPRFAEVIDECRGLVHEDRGLDLLAIIEGRGDAGRVDLSDATVGQPVLFSVQLALAHLLASWRIEPRAVLGHSIGEYAAACFAGAMSLRDAMTLVHLRSHVLEEAGEGAMTAVLADEAEIRALMEPELTIAAVNAPGSVVVSGPDQAVARFDAAVAERELRYRRLPITVAGHSSLLDPLLPEFRREARSIDFRPLEIDLISSLTGERLPAGTVLDADYWTRHLREPVLFGAATETALLGRTPLLVEVGAGHALGNIALRVAGTRPLTVAGTLPMPDDDLSPQAAVLQAPARAWSAGVPVDWDAVDDVRSRRRVTLTGYAFASERHWLEPRALRGQPPGPGSETQPQDAATAAREAGGPHDESPVTSPTAPSGLDPVEATVASIWSSLLGRPVTSADDNFFALGGDSLLLVRFMAKLRESHPVAVPLRSVAANPTVRAVSVLVSQAQHHEAP